MSMRPLGVNQRRRLEQRGLNSGWEVTKYRSRKIRCHSTRALAKQHISLEPDSWLRVR